MLTDARNIPRYTQYPWNEMTVDALHANMVHVPQFACVYGRTRFCRLEQYKKHSRQRCIRYDRCLGSLKHHEKSWKLTRQSPMSAILRRTCPARDPSYHNMARLPLY